MEQLKQIRDNKLTAMNQIANLIGFEADKTIKGENTTMQGRNEITRYAKEIVRIAKSL